MVVVGFKGSLTLFDVESLCIKTPCQKGDGSRRIWRDVTRVGRLLTVLGYQLVAMKEEPVAFLQLAQWQSTFRIGSPVISNLILPQRHEPVRWVLPSVVMIVDLV